jgi:hypothetical protein
MSDPEREEHPITSGPTMCTNVILYRHHTAKYHDAGDSNYRQIFYKAANDFDIIVIID